VRTGATIGEMSELSVRHILFTAAAGLAAAPGAVQAAENARVAFPEAYEQGVHYATVNRGGIREELFVGREAVEAAKRGQPLPEGTVIMLEDYREGRLYRYVVMEKRAGWGDAYPADLRNGDWDYREFRADKTPNPAEDGTRCLACHKSQAGNDFVFTYDRLRAAR